MAEAAEAVDAPSFELGDWRLEPDRLDRLDRLRGDFLDFPSSEEGLKDWTTGAVGSVVAAPVDSATAAEPSAKPLSSAAGVRPASLFDSPFRRDLSGRLRGDFFDFLSSEGDPSSLGAEGEVEAGLSSSSAIGAALEAAVSVGSVAASFEAATAATAASSKSSAAMATAVSWQLFLGFGRGLWLWLRLEELVGRF